MKRSKLWRVFSLLLAIVIASSLASTPVYAAKLPALKETFESKRNTIGKFKGKICSSERGQYSWIVLVSTICKSEVFYLYEEKMGNQCGAPSDVHQ